MDKDNIKMKYVLGIYTSMSDFPTIEDILYEITKDDDISSYNLFTVKRAIKLVSFKTTQEKLNIKLNELVDAGFLNKNGAKFLLNDNT